ncbi:MAG: acid phosphatase [Xanthomonadaceae bacterium]|nr:acid phosphatase [Xanthomonadaceae bacterium]MDE1886242.1 acid phosphatase [Xanthomonadaceae bacterium]MDE2085180.1 acid phosphatase [Xanthomonadaceae bacterium]MDE2258207.1 acid phosphatase [Xanthomonadaceae bacterium]
MTLRPVFPFIAAAVLAGCAGAAQKPAMYAGASASSKYAGNDLLNAAVWMQTSVEHDLVYAEIYRMAEGKLLAALGDPQWDALPRGERTHDAAKLPPAVIVDIDETVLDNAPFEARMIRDDVTFNAQAWNAWVRQASARPLPGALEYAKFAAAHGVTMIYISNRDVTQADSTRANLAADGFPLTDAAVLNRGVATPGCVDRDSGDKGCRRRLVAQRYRVLAMFGDQLGDFIDGADADNATRAERIAPYRDWFGARWFALPNPAYGSWESALTKHNPDKNMRADPRAAKHAALRSN